MANKQITKYNKNSVKDTEVVMINVMQNIKVKTYGLNTENEGAVGEISFVLVWGGGG